MLMGLSLPQGTAGDAMEVDEPPKRRQCVVSGEATIRIARQIEMG
jgi:hypothetical protein